ncbi:MAG TPA: hypothetical protein VMI32_16510 [Candidatus Solibacter sp.]|nr:hypothetical protein [Candidatus Solibacter sp.]
MNSGMKKMLFSLGLAGMVIVAAGWRASAWVQRGDDEIVGTWNVTVQLNDCNGNKLGSTFPSLLSFADGQTFTEDTLNQSFAVGQRGPGHGIWEFRGHHSYYAKQVAFINFTTTPPPPPGFTQGTQTVTQTIDFNDGPDQWTANANVSFADLSGTTYRTACATATATRME